MADDISEDQTDKHIYYTKTTKTEHICVHKDNTARVGGSLCFAGLKLNY